MKLNFKRGVTARQVAEMHLHLAAARLAIRAALCETKSTIGNAPCQLAASSHDALARVASTLSAAIYSMESTFMRVTNDATAPFAEPSRPTEWLEWLDTQGDE